MPATTVTTSTSLLRAADPVAPEEVPLSEAQYDVVQLAVVAAGFALLAGFLHHVTARDEVGARYRPAVHAGIVVTAVAALSYLLLWHELRTGYSYDAAGSSYVPTDDARHTVTTRYLDWTVTVPVLTVELLAVCTLVGRRLSRARAVAMAAAFAMVVTGYLGDQVLGGGDDRATLWLWWAVSSVFLLVVYAVLVPAARAAARDLPGEAGRTVGLAAVVLLTTFLVYPLVYLFQLGTGGGWTAALQVGFSAADVVAKVGFGVLVHKAAKLRTAADVAAGEETHPEPVWIDHVHHSDGVQPVRRHAS